MRHGRTPWNAQGRYQGHSDVALDEVGLTQARAVARALRPERYDRAVTSDLSRARTTAQIVLAGRVPTVPLATDARWREFDFGAWEGLSWIEIEAQFPEARGRPTAGGRFVTPTGGSESFDDLVDRVGAAVATLRASAERTIVFTHAGPLHALLRLASGSESEALAVRFEPASINRFNVTAAGLSVVATNEIAK